MIGMSLNAVDMVTRVETRDAWLIKGIDRDKKCVKRIV